MSIVVSILLAFLKQTLEPDRDPAVYKKLRRQVSLYSQNPQVLGVEQIIRSGSVQPLVC